MPQTPHSVDTAATVDIERVLKRNYFLLIGLLSARVGVSAALIALPVTVVEVSGLADPGFWVVPAVVSIGLLILTLCRVGCGIRLVQCAKVLRNYPLEFRPIVDRKPTSKALHGNVHTVRLRVPDQHGALWMWGMNAAGSRRWPAGAEDGVWFAGDPPFGGVMVVPGSNRLMFLSPSDWQKQARRREQAGPERVARAERANLMKNHWREPRTPVRG